MIHSKGRSRTTLKTKKEMSVYRYGKRLRHACFKTTHTIGRATATHPESAVFKSLNFLIPKPNPMM